MSKLELISQQIKRYDKWSREAIICVIDQISKLYLETILPYTLYRIINLKIFLLNVCDKTRTKSVLGGLVNFYCSWLTSPCLATFLVSVFTTYNVWMVWSDLLSGLWGAKTAWSHCTFLTSNNKQHPVLFVYSLLSWYSSSIFNKDDPFNLFKSTHY